MTPAALLREARRRAGLSQRQLAERAGVSQPVVAAYEAGRNQPSVPQLARLVRAAGFALDLHLRPAGPDPEASGRTLVELLHLADRLPQRHAATLAYPPLPAGPRQVEAVVAARAAGPVDGDPIMNLPAARLAAAGRCGHPTKRGPCRNVVGPGRRCAAGHPPRPE